MEIDFRKIKQPKVRAFLRKFGLITPADFSKMKPVCFNEVMAPSYKKYVKTFLIEKDINTVWKTYSTIHPREAWDGQMIGFGLQYSRISHAINYLNDPYVGMEKGQIIILNLKIASGLLNIAVAHQVAEVNEQQRIIKLCYMEGGATEGSQWISFHETKEGFTEVVHLTLYKGKSNFRDTKLYPPLHAKAISEFHGNVRKKIMSVEV